MIIGASLGSFLGLELDEALRIYGQLARELNLEAVELRLEREPGRPSLWPWEVQGGTEDTLLEFLAGFKVKGAHLPFIYLNPICPNQGIAGASIREIENGIDVASRLGMNYALTHIYGVAYGMSRNEQLERWAEIMEGLVAQARRRSIMLTMENGALLSDLKDLADMVRRINSPALRITLDTGHAYTPQAIADQHAGGAIFTRVLTPWRSAQRRLMPFARYGTLKRFVEQEKDLIYNLHVHDNNGVRDHLLLGEGEIDFTFLRMVSDRPLIVESLFNEAERDMRLCHARLAAMLTPFGRKNMAG